MALKETWSYLRNFMKDPKVGAVTPCSRHTVKRLCDKLELNQVQTVVEYGPGSGVYTRYLLNHMPAEAKLIVIEINETFVNKLQPLAEQDSRLRIHHAQVERLSSILEWEGVAEMDAVISGIPFSMIPLKAKERILSETNKYLKPGGKFLAYQTSFALVPKLKVYFDEVRKDLEPKNIPPMYLMEGRKLKTR